MAITPAATDVLVIVDMQNDFCAGGSLPTADGHAVVPVINRVARQFENVVMTQDWHPPGHISFASAHPGKQAFETIQLSYGAQMLWPDHVVQGSWGAEFHPDLQVPQAQLVIRKGYLQEIDSYSAFCMVDGKTRTGLNGYLAERGFKRLFVVGCALDYCVGGLALDAQKAGFATFVVADGAACIDPKPGGSAERTWAELAAAGVSRVTNADFG